MKREAKCSHGRTTKGRGCPICDAPIPYVVVEPQRTPADQFDVVLREVVK